MSTSVGPMLGALDVMYSTQAVLSQQAKRYGPAPQGWPPGVLRQLRDRNTAIFGLIERRICSMQAAPFSPLGQNPHSQNMVMLLLATWHRHYQRRSCSNACMSSAVAGMSVVPAAVEHPD